MGLEKDGILSISVIGICVDRFLWDIGVAGTPWSEEEHKRFLIGLKKVGKGDWRGISKNYVKTRTPTQVASHAQKYFLRHNTVKRRRRSSLFDITTEMVNYLILLSTESDLLR